VKAVERDGRSFGLAANIADRPLAIKGEQPVFNSRAVFACTSLLTGVLASAPSVQEESTPRYEIGLNYSWLHVNSANYDYHWTGNGGSGYFLYNLVLAGDFGGYANTRTGINHKALTYLFGPRFTWLPFALEPLCTIPGGEYVWSGPNDNCNKQNAFARASGGHQNDVRYSEGVVLRMGEK
jgi:hypothetical protein